MKLYLCSSTCFMAWCNYAHRHLYLYYKLVTIKCIGTFLYTCLLQQTNCITDLPQLRCFHLRMSQVQSLSFLPCITGHFSPHSLPFYTEEGCRITSSKTALLIPPMRVSQISLSFFINLIKPTNTVSKENPNFQYFF